MSGWWITWEWIQTIALIVALYIVWRMVDRVHDLEWQLRSLRQIKRSNRQEETNEA
jgi:hypothetical protein